MDGEKETVSVKWWNHKSALCRAIRDIYMKNLYADVRLICEGNEHWVHKFVLSACSEYFEDILAEVPHQGYVNLPSSVRQKELLSLLDFMYLGIVDVLQEELPTLVGAAEVLMIRGLAIPYEEEESDQENVKVTKEIVSTPKTPKIDTNQTGISLKRERIDDESLTVSKEEVGEYYSERHLEPSTSNAALVSGRSPDQNCQVTSSNAEVNAMLKVLIGKGPKRGRKRQTRGTNDDTEKSEGVPKEAEALTCSQCNKTFQWRSNLTKHMRTHTGEKPYSCNICTYKTSYSEALKRHMRIHTGEKPYQCDYCDYKSRDHGSLKHHLKRHCSSRSSNPSSSNPQDSEQHLHSNTVISESSSAPNFMTLDSDRQQRSETISEAFITSHVNSGNINT